MLAARRGGPRFDELPPAIDCYVLKEDLSLRGFAAPELRAQVQIADYAQLVQLFDEHTRMIGAL